MGRSGEKLRAERKRTTYTFTAEQLAARDRAMRDEAMRNLKDAVDAEKRRLKKLVAEQEERLNGIHLGKQEDVMLEAMKLLLAIPVKVLVDEFGWKHDAGPERYNRRLKINRFGSALTDEIMHICNDDVDVMEYAERVFQTTGIRFDVHVKEE